MELKDKFPATFRRYELYIEFFHQKTGVQNIQDAKDYQAIILKSLIAYFLYKERFILKRKTGKITLKDIAIFLGYKDHTGVLYSIKRIKNMLYLQPKYPLYKKTISYYYYIFHCIFFYNYKN